MRCLLGRHIPAARIRWHFDGIITKDTEDDAKYEKDGENMDKELLKKSRIVDTFAARDLQMPSGLDISERVGEYSLRKGYGLKLRRRKSNRKKQAAI